LFDLPVPPEEGMRLCAQMSDSASADLRHSLCCAFVVGLIGVRDLCNYYKKIHIKVPTIVVLACLIE
jgi:hypothetical protein